VKIVCGVFHDKLIKMYVFTEREARRDFLFVGFNERKCCLDRRLVSLITSLTILKYLSRGSSEKGDCTRKFKK
jgi:hypothetical protein